MANEYIAQKVEALKLASHRQDMRQPIVDIFTELDNYALPEVTSDNAGKTLVVGSDGRWTIGDLPNSGGGVILYPLKAWGLLDTLIGMSVNLGITQTEEQKMIVDMSNARIRALRPGSIGNAYLGLGAQVWIKQNDTSSFSNATSASVSRVDGGSSGVIGIVCTLNWAGSAVYISNSNNAAPIYEITGISFEAGDTLGFTIGIQLA